MGRPGPGLGLAVAAALGALACPRPPLEFGPEGRIDDGAKLLVLLDKRARGLNGLKASAKVSVESLERKGSVDELVAVARPASLHLETLSFFGKPMAVLVSTGEQFSLYDSEKNVFYRGPATPRNLARLLPVALDPADVVSILLGTPGHASPKAVALAVDEDRRAYVATLVTNEGARQVFVVGTRDLRVLAAEGVGAPGYEIGYDDFDETPAGAVARRIHLKAPGDHLTVEVSLSDLELNPQPDPTLYDLQPPPGARIVGVD